MGIGAVAGRTLNLLESTLARAGRVNPWLALGLAGAAIGGAFYKKRRDEKRTAEAVRDAFREEIRQRDLWEDVRSQVAGASQDLFRTFQVYRKGEVKPVLERAHERKPGEGEFVVPVDGPDLEQACDLLGRALANLARSRVNDLAVYRETGRDVSGDAAAALKRVKARLERARAGTVKRPDIPGLQGALNGLLEERIQPVIGDLCYVIEQGALRVRAERREGARRRGGA